MILISSFQDVEPYLEYRDSGPTYDWCKEIAKRFECYVVACYPEKRANGNAFLSQVVLDPEGKVVGVHRDGRAVSNLIYLRKYLAALVGNQLFEWQDLP